MATSRTDRSLARGRRAAAQVCVHGGSALVAASVQIEVTFSSAMRHLIFKDRVAALIHCGAAHPKVRVRYQKLVERHPVRNLDAAIVLAGRMRCAEREARAAAVRSCGHFSRSRLRLTILDEVCLILRMLRRYAPTLFIDVVMEIQTAGVAMPARASTAAHAGRMVPPSTISILAPSMRRPIRRNDGCN